MASPIVSEDLRTSFAALQREVEASYAIARAARARGFDPEIDVEIPLTQDLASRVERLLKEYDVEGVARRIRELAKQHDREEVAIVVAKGMAARPAPSKERAGGRAGGTGQALSVLIADIVRRELGIGRYQPTKEEVERFKEEIPLYKQVQHLQYAPTDEEIALIVSNCPVGINGEGTEDAEISGYRDLPRIEE